MGKTRDGVASLRDGSFRGNRCGTIGSDVDCSSPSSLNGVPTEGGRDVRCVEGGVNRQSDFDRPVFLEITVAIGFASTSAAINVDILTGEHDKIIREIFKR